MTTTPSQVLTSKDFGGLALVMDVFLGDRKVARAREDGSIVYGVARHLIKGPDNFGFIGPDMDLRDAYLRVTGKMGEEWVWPVRELMAETLVGKFAKYDW